MAWRTFPEWAAILSKATAILRSCGEEFASLVTLKMGKLIPGLHRNSQFGGIENSGYGREPSGLGI
jgi:acyl-CoA reductase-like NAD-dependent aldehyde dehydrogenase